jgi:hypothetical protein
MNRKKKTNDDESKEEEESTRDESLDEIHTSTTKEIRISNERIDSKDILLHLERIICLFM